MFNRNQTISIKADCLTKQDIFSYETTLVLLLWSSCINYCLRMWQIVFFNNQSVPNTLYLNIGIIAFYLLVIIVKKFKFLKLDMAIFVVGALLVAGISVVLNGTWWLTFNNTALHYFGKFVFSYILVRGVKNWDLFIRIFCYLSRIGVVLSSITYILTYSYIPYRSTPELYMFFSCSLVFSMFGMVINIFRHNIFFDKLITLLMFSFIFMSGSRGSLIQIVFFFILYLIIHKKLSKGVLLFSILFCAFLLVFPYLQDTSFFRDLLKSSRTISMIFSGNIISDSGRTSGQNEVIDYFFSQSDFKVLFGMGIAGERFYLTNYTNLRAGYPHNFFIEIILHFGLIGGAMIIVLTMIVSIRSLLKIYKNVNDLDVAIVFLSNMTVLLFTSSYLISEFYSVWIGFCLNTCLNKHVGQHKKESE